MQGMLHLPAPVHTAINLLREQRVNMDKYIAPFNLMNFLTQCITKSTSVEVRLSLFAVKCQERSCLK